MTRRYWVPHSILTRRVCPVPEVLCALTVWFHDEVVGLIGKERGVRRDKPARGKG
jgi:hypothetical protein